MRKIILIAIILSIWLVHEANGDTGSNKNSDDLSTYGFLDVTKPPYDAVGDGITDNSAAFKSVIKDAYEKRMVVYVPSGTYLLSEQLNCRMELLSPDEGRRLYAFQIVGSTKGSKPVLKLKDNCDVAGFVKNAFILFETYRDQSLQDPSNYGHLLRNIRIDLGNNPEISGVSMSGAQLCAIEDVEVTGEDFSAGFIDLPGSGGSSINISVEGGRYGILQQAYRPNPSVAGLVLKGQKEAGIKIENYGCRGPLIVSGFLIESNSSANNNYVAVKSETDEAIRGDICMADGIIDLYGVGHIGFSTVKADISLKNIYIKAERTGILGSGKKVIDGNRPGWSLVKELAWSNNGSSIYNNLSAVYGYWEDITDTTAPPEGLAMKHSWQHVESWEDENTVNVVADYGATPYYIDPQTMEGIFTIGSKDNDADKIQQALDDVSNPSNPNYGKTVFIPKGLYHINKTLNIPAGVKLIGSGKTNCILMMEGQNWADENDPIVKTKSGTEGKTVLSDFAIYGYPRCRLLVVESANTLARDLQLESLKWTGFRFKNNNKPYVELRGDAGGDFYNFGLDHVSGDDKTDIVKPTGDYTLLKVTDTHNTIRFYQISIEHLSHSPQTDLSNAATIEIYGFKFEDEYELLHAQNIRNLLIWGGSGNYGIKRDENKTILKLTDCSKVLIANLVRKEVDGELEGKDWLETESINIPDDNNLLFYKQENIPSGSLYRTMKPFWYYPNPTKRKLVITGLDESNKSKIEVYNEMGAIVKKMTAYSSNVQLDLGDIPSGTYFLKINREGAVKIVKI